MAATAAGAGSGRGRRIQDGGGQAAASSRVDEKGQEYGGGLHLTASAPSRGWWRALKPALRSPHWGSGRRQRLPFTFALPASTFLRRCSCSSSSISLQESSRAALEETGPTRRRLHSIYTPPPSLGLALPRDNCHADVNPPRASSALAPGRLPPACRQSGVTFLPSRMPAQRGAGGIEFFAGLRLAR